MRKLPAHERLPDLPEELVEEVRQLYNATEGHQWVFGDLLVGIVDELGEKFANMIERDTPEIAYRHARAHIIRTIANKIGCDGSTLRDRESMSRFYPYEVRERYNMLTYHQLRACKAAGERWEEFAEYASANLPAPVSLIRAMIRGSSMPVPAWVKRWGHIYDTANQILLYDYDAPKKIREAARDILRVGEMKGG